ncbi:major facilitator superfamily transporter [Diaporthe helianthi]|uniref:Major facilitator superfamily transporter n=1 Tax=Diaporthe helianthi TaxID=158607 RepID=A0A2P5HWV0_DIAHE|nr:major facilitator superfamily transporter [Diaporthe helianthi]
MKQHEAKAVGGGGDANKDSWEKWTAETKAAIEFEEDPHRAALFDNPKHVHVGKKTWAALIALGISLGAPIGLTFLTLNAILVAVTEEVGGQNLIPWVVGAWSVASASTAGMGGYLSDIFGRRNIILVGNLLVFIGSILGATARSIVVIITAQALVGMGTGFLFDAYAAATEMLPNKWRALAAGVVEAGINVPWATISGVLGNVVARYASWRWVYYISILWSFLAFKATALLYWPVSRPRGDFHKTRAQQFKELDYIGLLSITAGLVILVSGLTLGGETYPWDHPLTVAPLTVGPAILLLGCVYDWTVAANPMIPLRLFKPVMFRRYVAILIVLFMSGMNFHALSTLLPQGSLLMFTTDGMQIGVMSLPNTVMQLVVGVVVPIISHRIPDYIPHCTIKWQVVAMTAMQVVFLALSAVSVDPNNYYAYILLTGLGVSMFTGVTVISYALVGMHVPHSQLGTALGFLGTFRSTGGAVGNAIFGYIFQRSSEYMTAKRLRPVCERFGACPTEAAFNTLLVDAVAFNQGAPGKLIGLSPEVQRALQDALRGAYGYSFKVVFCATIPLGVVALLCAFWIDDPHPFMNNHVQFRMYERGGLGFRKSDSPAPTGATVLLSARKKHFDGNGGDEGDLELTARAPSQESQERLNP